MKIQLEVNVVHELIVLLNSAAGILESSSAFDESEKQDLAGELVHAAKDLVLSLKEPKP